MSETVAKTATDAVGKGGEATAAAPGGVTDGQPAGEGPRLKDAIRRLKIAEAERADVVVELREAERARLDILLQKLSGVIDELPDTDEQFELAVLPGETPRLFVDVTGFVVMARDKRTYRFLKDTRLGRTVIAESRDVEEMAGRVTDYVATRLIERERALAADELRPTALVGEAAARTARHGDEASLAAAASVARARPSTARVVVAFVTGIVIGGLAATAYFGALPWR